MVMPFVLYKVYKRKIFASNLHLFSHILLSFTLIFFGVLCSTLEEFKLINILSGKKPEEGKFAQIGFYILATLLTANILLEIVHSIVDVCSKSNQKKKTKNQVSAEKIDSTNELGAVDASQQQAKLYSKMPAPFTSSKTKQKRNSVRMSRIGRRNDLKKRNSKFKGIRKLYMKRGRSSPNHAIDRSEVKTPSTFKRMNLQNISLKKATVKS